jgi:uncharacterized protein
VNVYAGTIRHRRFAVRPHAFRHRIALAYLDLEHPPRGGRLVRFEPSDYLSVSEVRELAGHDGPVHLLAALRSFGHCFNPIALYYCFDGEGALRHVVAEVTNTPWGEKHAYVMAARGEELDKALHVSPFMGMDQTYALRTVPPGETLSVHIESRDRGVVAFDATLKLRRRPFSRRALAGASLRTLALIYAHALVLKLKRVPVHPHPEAS